MRYLLGGALLCVLAASLATSASGALHKASPLPTVRALINRGAHRRLHAPVHFSKLRSRGSWAFGAATLPPSGTSDGIGPTVFFVAHLHHRKWQVGLQGTRTFVKLVRAAPHGLVPHAIVKAVLASPATPGGAGGGPDFSLPWATGQTWTLVGGPHNTNGNNRHPFTSLDFNGSLNGPVRAAADGVAYRPCSNLVIVDHGGGWETGYYHMPDSSITVPLGGHRNVHRGDVLGVTNGYHVGCGGPPNKPQHVHFSIYHFSASTSSANSIWHLPSDDIDGTVIGGYVVHDGSQDYGGYLQRISDGQRVNPGGGVYNDGTVGGGGCGTSCGKPTYHTTASTNVYSGPGTSYSTIGSLTSGTPVDIVCQTKTSSVVGNSAIWDKIADNRYVPDYNVSTLYDGQFSPGLSQCQPDLTYTPPSVSAVMDGNSEDLYWRATNGTLFEESFNGAWHGPVQVKDSAGLGSAPSAVLAGGPSEDVFWKSTDGSLSEESFNSGAWHGPAAVPGSGTLGSAPSVVKGNMGEEIFWKGTNGPLYRELFNGSWSGALQVPNSGTLGSSPTAVENGSTESVLWKGTNGFLYEASRSDPFSADSWSGATQVPNSGVLDSSPNAVVAGGSEDVFWKGTDGALWEESYVAAKGQWFGPVSVPGTRALESAPSAVVTPWGSEDVFWKAAGGLMEESYNNGAWHGPAPVPNSTAGGGVG